MNISYLKSMIKKGKIVREGEALFVLKKDGRLKALGGNETFDAYIKCLNIIRLEQRIAEIDERLEEAEEAVIRRRDEGLPTADAVEVVVELRRHRELNINKLKNYKKEVVMKEVIETFGKRLKIVTDESDDERIRRKFIEALKECGFTHFPNEFTIDEAITWLEKQSN